MTGVSSYTPYYRWIEVGIESSNGMRERDRDRDREIKKPGRNQVSRSDARGGKLSKVESKTR